MYLYVLRRLLYAIPVLLAVSVLSFVIIQLPPGDYATTEIMKLDFQGTPASEAQRVALVKEYGLDRPAHERYFVWMGGLLRGDLGRSFLYKRPVTDVIGERILLTMTIAILSIAMTWMIAIPIGIYSATHQYSISDYLVTFVGFVGVSMPPFLVAMVLMYLALAHFDLAITGLFSDEFAKKKVWSVAKFIDMLKHIWLPALIVSVANTAAIIRVMRGCLLDELRKQYVPTARARGLGEWRLTLKYPVRMAINPLLSTIGWMLPAVVSGEVIVSIVLNLPTVGPMLFEALRSQDMHLAGSLIMILSALTIIGTLISDILLAWSDPRIRYE